MAMLLLQRDATVTICHSKTPDLPAVARDGRHPRGGDRAPGFVTPAFVKPGATVIDVGINRVTDLAVARRLFEPGAPRLADFERRGSIVVGDVHPEVAEVAGALTPVPGGVGPLTIAMLLKNTVAAAQARAPAADRHAARRADRRDRDGEVVLPASASPRSARPSSTPTSSRARSSRRARRGWPRWWSDSAPPSSTAGRLARSRRARTARLRRRGRARRPRGDHPSARLPRDPRLVREPAARHRAWRWPTSRCCSRPGTSTTSTRSWSARAAPAEQLRRLMARDGLSEPDARARLAAQWPIEEKVGARGLRRSGPTAASRRPMRRSGRLRATPERAVTMPTTAAVELHAPTAVATKRQKARRTRRQFRECTAVFVSSRPSPLRACVQRRGPDVSSTAAVADSAFDVALAGAIRSSTNVFHSWQCGHCQSSSVLR